MNATKSHSSSHFLFELIQNLSPSEKRYFKVYVSRNSIRDSSNYLNLFNLIAQQKHYDEFALKKQLENTSLASQFSVTKHYLYQQILKSLELYHYNKTTDRKLRSLENQLEVLFEKGLYSQSQKLLTKALSLAKEHEKHLHIIELSLWQSRIMMKEFEHKDLEKQLKNNYDIINKSQEHLQSLTDLNFLDNKMLILIKKHGIVRNEQDEKPYKKIYQLPSVQDFSGNTFWELYFYHHLKSLYYYTTGEYEKSYSSRKALLDLFKNNSSYKKENIHEYIAALNNFILVCHQLGKKEEFESKLKKLKKIKSSNVETQVRVFVNSYTLELLDNYNKGKFNEIIELSKGIDKQLNNFGHRVDLSSRVLFYFIIAASFIATRKYEDALQYFSKLINTPRSDEIQDLYRYARIISLIAHYELDNTRILNSHLTSVKRYLKSKNKLFKLETNTLKLLKEIAKEDVNVAAHFSDYLHDLNDILKDPFEEKALAYFDFKSWAESKLTGKKMEELIRKASA